MRFSKSLFFSTFLWTASLSLQAHPLVQWVETHKTSEFAELPKGFQTEVRKYVNSHGRVTEELQKALTEIETRYAKQFTSQSRADFQDLLAEIGAKMTGEIQMPRDQTPFWLVNKGPLNDYRHSAKIPKEADVVIIGAGLTGTSAAYHLSDTAKSGKVVVVLEEGQIASQSSGKNGGNFQLIPESYVGHYEGIIGEREKWLSKQKPQLSKEEIRQLAEVHAKALYTFSFKNMLRFLDINHKEKLNCDFSSKGWLKVSSDLAEEKMMLLDNKWIKDLGDKEPFEAWSAEKIVETTKIPAKHVGRFVANNGNYHPYKFVTEVLKKSIAKGVQLYTKVHVENVTPTHANGVEVLTSEGMIRAKKVIVATNAFTPLLFPELSAIKVHVSQIMDIEHVKNNLQGMTITEQYGDIYYHFPKSKIYEDRKQNYGTLHYGLDQEGEFPNANNIATVESHFKKMKVQTDARFPDSKGIAPSRMWVGPMAFTDDRVPLIGFFHPKNAPTVKDNNIIVAAGFQGYGGSFCVHAGYLASQMTLSGKVHPDVPEDLFSPERFHDKSAVMD